MGAMLTSLRRKGREKVISGQPHLYPLTPHLIILKLVLRVPKVELFSKTWNQSSSHLNSGQKRKEKTISFSLSCLSLSFLLFLLIFVILFYSLPSFALPPSHFSNLFLHFQFLPLPVYISSLHLQLIPPEELHELTSCLLDIFLIPLEARY